VEIEDEVKGCAQERREQSEWQRHPLSQLVLWVHEIYHQDPQYQEWNEEINGNARNQELEEEKSKGLVRVCEV